MPLTFEFGDKKFEFPDGMSRLDIGYKLATNPDVPEAVRNHIAEIIAPQTRYLREREANRDSIQSPVNMREQEALIASGDVDSGNGSGGYQSIKQKLADATRGILGNAGYRRLIAPVADVATPVAESAISGGMDSAKAIAAGALNVASTTANTVKAMADMSTSPQDRAFFDRILGPVYNAGAAAGEMATGLTLSADPNRAREVSDVADAYRRGGVLGAAAAVGELTPQLAQQVSQLAVSGGAAKLFGPIGGPIAATFPQEAGGNYQQNLDEGAQRGPQAAAAALASGAASAALEPIEDYPILKRLEAGAKPIKNIGKFIAEQGSREGATEAAQSLSSDFGQAASGARVPTASEIAYNAANQGTIGALTGIATGAAGAAPNIADRITNIPRDAARFVDRTINPEKHIGWDVPMESRPSVTLQELVAKATGELSVPETSDKARDVVKGALASITSFESRVAQGIPVAMDDILAYVSSQRQLLDRYGVQLKEDSKPIEPEKPRWEILPKTIPNNMEVVTQPEQLSTTTQTPPGGEIKNEGQGQIQEGQVSVTPANATGVEQAATTTAPAKTFSDKVKAVFKTSKGSEYTLYDDGNTVRMKRSPGQGQGEIQPRLPVMFVSDQAATMILAGSDTKPVLVSISDNGDVKRIRPAAGENIDDGEDGKALRIFFITPDGRASAAARVSLTPQIGMHPFEMGYDGVIKTTHIGHAISEITRPDGTVEKAPVVESNEEPAKPAENAKDPAKPVIIPIDPQLGENLWKRFQDGVTTLSGKSDDTLIAAQQKAIHEKWNPSKEEFFTWAAEQEAKNGYRQKHVTGRNAQQTEKQVTPPEPAAQKTAEPGLGAGAAAQSPAGTSDAPTAPPVATASPAVTPQVQAPTAAQTQSQAPAPDPSDSINKLGMDTGSKKLVETTQKAYERIHKAAGAPATAPKPELTDSERKDLDAWIKFTIGISPNGDWTEHQSKLNETGIVFKTFGPDAYPVLDVGTGLVDSANAVQAMSEIAKKGASTEVVESPDKAEKGKPVKRTETKSFVFVKDNDTGNILLLPFYTTHGVSYIGSAEKLDKRNAWESSEKNRFTKTGKPIPRPRAYENAITFFKSKTKDGSNIKFIPLATVRSEKPSLMPPIGKIDWSQKEFDHIFSQLAPIQNSINSSRGTDTGRRTAISDGDVTAVEDDGDDKSPVEIADPAEPTKLPKQDSIAEKEVDSSKASTEDIISYDSHNSTAIRIEIATELAAIERDSMVPPGKLDRETFDEIVEQVVRDNVGLNIVTYMLSKYPAMVKHIATSNALKADGSSIAYRNQATNLFIKETGNYLWPIYQTGKLLQTETDLLNSQKRKGVRAGFEGIAPVMNLADAAGKILSSPHSSGPEVAARLLFAREIIKLMGARGINPLVKVLNTEQLAELGVTRGVPASYSIKDNTIYLNKDKLNPALTQAELLHEALHASTSFFMAHDVKFRNEVRAIRDGVFKHLTSIGVIKEDGTVDQKFSSLAYAFKPGRTEFASLQEFVAEAFSNRDLGNLMTELPSIKKVSWLTRLYNATLGKLLGKTPNAEQTNLLTDLLAVVHKNFAAQMPGGAGGESLDAAVRWKDAAMVEEALATPGLIDESKALILAEAGAQSAMVPDSVLNHIESLKAPASGTVDTRNAWDLDTYKKVKWLEDAAKAAPKKPLDATNKSQHAIGWAAGVLLFDDQVKSSVSRITNWLKVAQAKMEDNIEKWSKVADSEQLKASYIGAAADTMITEYNAYIKGQQALNGGVIDSADKEVMDRAANMMAFGNRATIISELRKAIEVIADAVPDAIVEIGREAITDYVIDHNILSGKVEASVEKFLLEPTGSRRKGALLSYAGLQGAVKTLKRNAAKSDAIKTDIAEFKQWWSDIHGRTGVSDKPVSMRQFAQRYASMAIQRREALDTARSISRRIASLDRAIRAAHAAITLMEGMQQDPQYKQRYADALQVTNAMDFVSSGLQAHRIGKVHEGVSTEALYEIGGKKFKVDWSLTPGTEAENLSVISNMLSAIDEELGKPDVDESKKRGYRFLRSYAEKYLSDASSLEQFGTLQLGSVDIINKTKRFMVLVKFLQNRDFVYKMMPGRIGSNLRLMAHLQDSIHAKIRALQDDKRIGSVALNYALSKAVASHIELSPEDWDRMVMEPLIAANQEDKGRGLRVNEYTVFGHKITREDYDAMLAMRRFSDALYNIISGVNGKGGVIVHNPTLIVSGSRMRVGYAGGKGTLPRRLMTGGRDTQGTPEHWLYKWNKASADESEKVRAANRLTLMDDPDFFQHVVVPYVGELNPEFSRSSPDDAIYKILADRWAGSGLTVLPRDTRELVESIAELKVARELAKTGTRPSDEEVEALKKKMEAEAYHNLESGINGIMVAYADAANKHNATLDQIRSGDRSIGSDVLAEIINSENSFTKPRGTMVAPSTFYGYSIANPGKRGSLVHQAAMPVSLRELGLMDAALKVIDNEIARLKAMRRTGEITDKSISNDVRSGKLYGTISQLEIAKSHISIAIRTFKDKVSSRIGFFDKDNLLDRILAMDRVNLLSQMTTLVTNATSAMGSGRTVAAQAIGVNSPSASFFGAVKSLPSALIDAAAVAGSNNKALRNWAYTNRGALRTMLNGFAERILEAERARQIAMDVGAIGDQHSVKEMAKIAREMQDSSLGSPVGNEDEPIWLTGIRKVTSKGVAAYIVNILPRLNNHSERLANIVNIMAGERMLRCFFGIGYRIMQSRHEIGAPGWDNWNDPSNTIKAEEFKHFGSSAETIAVARSILAPLGSLEQVLHNYWKRASAVPKDMRSNVPLVDPSFEDAYQQVLLHLDGMVNLPLDSNRPDVLHGKGMLAKIYRSIFTFPGWIQSWMSTLGVAQMASGGRPFWNRVAYSGFRTLMLGLVMVIAGMSIQEIRKKTSELANNREFSAFTMSSFMADPTALSAARLFGSSIAVMIPYVGEVVADAVGAPTYKASITDLTKLSRAWSLMSGMKDNFFDWVKTGDTAGAIINTGRLVFPLGSVIANRIPAVQERNAIADASRVARVAAGPLETKEIGGSGTGASPTRFSSLIKRAVAAEGAGDDARAQRLIGEAIKVKAEAGDANPLGSVLSSVQSQAPDRKVFGRTLTPEEEGALIGRMTSNQASAYKLGSSAVRRLASSIQAPKKIGKGKRTPKNLGANSKRKKNRSPVRISM